MAQRDYTRHQERIIRNYYRNRGGLALQKLQDLVAELYLAETDRKRDQLWKRIGTAMAHLDISEQLREHILGSRRAEVLAANLKDWWSHPPKEKPKPPKKKP